MQFNDITKTIHDAWTFSWPPVALCIIFYLVSLHMDAEATRNALDGLLLAAKTYGTKLDSIKGLLEPYGLTKLIPIVSVVIVIGFLYVLNGPIRVLASKLPPHLSNSPDVLMARSMSQNEKLVLLRKFPAAEHFNAAYFMALRRHDTGSPQQTKHRAELNFKVHDFLKFAVLSALLLFVLNLKSDAPVLAQIIRLIGLVVLLVPLWCINFVMLLYNLEQQNYDEWASVRVELLRDAHQYLDKEESQEERVALDRLLEEPRHRWWRIYFFDPYYIKWLRSTFFPDRFRG